MQLLNIITLVVVATGISAHPVEVLSKVPDSPAHASTDYSTTGADGLGPNMEVRDIIDTPPGIEAKSKVAVIDVADRNPENQAGGGSRVQARHEGGKNIYEAEHISVADELKYKDNLAKLESGHCGTGCHDSMASYDAKVARLASYDAKVARHYGGGYEGGGGYHGGGYGGGGYGGGYHGGGYHGGGYHGGGYGGGHGGGYHGGGCD